MEAHSKYDSLRRGGGPGWVVRLMHVALSTVNQQETHHGHGGSKCYPGLCKACCIPPGQIWICLTRNKSKYDLLREERSLQEEVAELVSSWTRFRVLMPSCHCGAYVLLIQPQFLPPSRVYYQLPLCYPLPNFPGPTSPFISFSPSYLKNTAEWVLSLPIHHSACH